MRRLAAYYYSRLKQRLRRNLLLENLRLMNLVALWCFVLVCLSCSMPKLLALTTTVNWWTMCHDWNYKGGKNTVNKQWGNFGGEKQRRESVCFMFRKIGGVYSGDTRNTIIGFPVVNPFGTSMDFRGCRHGGVESGGEKPGITAEIFIKPITFHHWTQQSSQKIKSLQYDCFILFLHLSKLLATLSPISLRMT